jgi:hypothetical protein
MLLFGEASVGMHMDANWDLMDYHWYNAFALLNWRYDIDVAPAQINSFFNPLLDTAFYGLAHSLAPRSAAFVVGAIQGLGAVLLYLLSGPALRVAGAQAAPWFRIFIALAGTTGAAFVAELGTTFHDVECGLVVLCALVLLTRIAGPPEASRARAMWIALAAGLAAGAAAGLKWVAVPYVLGAGGAFSLAYRGRHTWRAALAFAAGCLAGLAAINGAWMALLYARTGNPVFPFFNQIFQSPLVPASSFEDTRFVPHSIWEGLVYPFVFLSHPRRVSDFDFRDPRLLTLIVALALWGAAILATTIRSRRFSRAAAGLNAALFFGVFAAISYVAWVFEFGIYRYAVPLEMLSPLVVALALARAIPSRAVATAATLAVVGITIAVTAPMLGGRRAWQPEWITVSVPAEFPRNGALVVMTGGDGYDPIAYVIPGFPVDTAFVRTGSNLIWNPPQSIELYRQMQRRIGAHPGPLYVLFAGPALPLKQTDELNLNIATEACAPLRTSMDETLYGARLTLCPLNRKIRASADAS